MPRAIAPALFSILEIQMPTTYSEAPTEAVSLLAKMLKAHHHDLVECKAQIGVLFASNDKGPAVKSNGYPRAAQVKVVSLKDRVRKKIDAEVIVDALVWERLTDDQRAALMDHELEHLRRVEWSAKRYKKMLAEDGDVLRWKLDSLGRPKLKTVPADIDVGDAFASIIQRHGKAACEFRNAAQFHEFAEKALAERAKA